MMLHNLRKVTDLHSVRHGNLAICGTLQSANELKNGGLSSTILTHKSDLITLADMKVYIIQKSEAAVCNC